MHWLLTLRAVRKNGSDHWCHAITDQSPLSFLHSLEKYSDTESYYLVNALQISAEEAEKYSGELHTE